MGSRRDYNSRVNYVSPKNQSHSYSCSINTYLPPKLLKATLSTCGPYTTYSICAVDVDEVMVRSSKELVGITNAIGGDLPKVLSQSECNLVVGDICCYDMIRSFRSCELGSNRRRITTLVIDPTICSPAPKL